MSAMHRPDTAAWDGLNDTQQAVLTCAWRIAKPGGMVLTKQICGRTGLSKSCVNDAIHVLLDRGLWLWRRMSQAEAGKLGAAKTKRWANHCKIMDTKEECDYIPSEEEIAFQAAAMRRAHNPQTDEIERAEQERREHLWLVSAQARRAWRRQNAVMN
jgi:hypothetical protein